MTSSLLVYDSACGPCRASMTCLALIDTKRKLTFVSISQADRGGVLEPVAPAARRRSFHLVSPGGKALSGAEAVPELAGLLPLGALTKRALQLPPLLHCVSLLYSLFVRIHDSSVCSFR